MGIYYKRNPVGQFAPTKIATISEPEKPSFGLVPVVVVEPEYDNDGYDVERFSRGGFDRNWQHRNGTPFDDEGYDICGFDIDRLHSNGTMFDDDGYDLDGYDVTGVNRGGNNRNGDHVRNSSE